MLVWICLESVMTSRVSCLANVILSDEWQETDHSVNHQLINHVIDFCQNSYCLDDSLECHVDNDNGVYTSVSSYDAIQTALCFTI